MTSAAALVGFCYLPDHPGISHKKGPESPKGEVQKSRILLS